MNVGIICDLTFEKHIGINNYFYAINNIFENVKLVNDTNDLDDIDILFIGNEHFQPHRKIWQSQLFQKKCNLNNIKIVIFSCERIFNSSFSHNVEIQKSLQQFDNLYQYAIDVDDVEILGCNLLQASISKKYSDVITHQDKENKCAFLGRTDCFSYGERKDLINNINKDIEIVFLKKQEKWVDYIKELSKYRFVLSPLGNANSLNLKFYEILLAKSIPIQQIRNNTLLHYKEESKFDDCVFFENVCEIKNKIINCTLQTSINMVYLESHITKLLKKDKII